MAILINQEIEKFKIEKEDKYLSVMKKMTEALSILHERSTLVWHNINNEVI